MIICNNSDTSFQTKSFKNTNCIIIYMVKHCSRCGKEITRFPFLKIPPEKEHLCDECIEEDMWNEANSLD
jgi:hypothetical protein